mgnify:CR=1 FL=1
MYTIKKMLELIEILKTKKVIRYNKDFCEAINLLPQNLIRIKNGEAHFAPEHIRAACKEFGVNANWIFGVEDKVLRA